MIRTKRVRLPAEPSDGKRFLVDGLWPRGQKKEAVPMDGWIKDAAPSAGLRKWFGHNPARWDEFRRRYFAELDERPESWAPLAEAARGGDITLLFDARDGERNNAIALREYLCRNMGQTVPIL